MAYALSPFTDIILPWSMKGWSFHANLEHIREWLTPLYSQSRSNLNRLLYPQSANAPSLAKIIGTMLAYGAQDRPSIDTVIEKLHDPVYGGNGYFIGACCRPPSSATLADLSQNHPHEV
jgi:hypothetical protein